MYKRSGIIWYTECQHMNGITQTFVFDLLSLSLVLVVSWKRKLTCFAKGLL